MRAVIFGIILIQCCVSIYGQQLTTVAVVDVQRVYDTFAHNENISSSISAIRNRYQQEISDIMTMIDELRQQLRDARADDNSALVADIDASIDRAEAEINRLNQERNTALSNRRRLLLPENFIPQLQRAIVFVAESEGYSVVFKADDEGLQWWSSVVDITNSVVNRLVAQVDR